VFTGGYGRLGDRLERRYDVSRRAAKCGEALMTVHGNVTVSGWTWPLDVRLRTGAYSAECTVCGAIEVHWRWKMNESAERCCRSWQSRLTLRRR